MKIYQCGFSSFIYELFRDPNGCIRATKTSVKDGTLCLEKQFDNEEVGRQWIIDRNDQDQKFMLACAKLLGDSEGSAGIE